MAEKRKFHTVRNVGNEVYRFHCIDCDKYFTREPHAATCKPKTQGWRQFDAARPDPGERTPR